MTKTFLLLRQKSAAQKTAAKLQNQGFKAIIEPIFSVEKLLGKITKTPAALIITSANACEAVIKSNIALDVKIFAVGRKSAAQLVAAGYENIFYPETNSALHLQKLVTEKMQPKNGLIVYFCGDSISLDFKSNLEPLGFAVEKILSYKINWHENFSAEFLQKISATKIDFILFYSQNSVTNFYQLAKKNNLLEYFSNSKLLCLSDKIAIVAENLGFKNLGKFNEIPF